MAESENVYVKIGQSGRLLERTAEREIDHATLRALGWKLKGSKDAPTRKDETASKPAITNPTATVPTSAQAQAAVVGEGKPAGSAGDAAGAAADAKSQAAAGH
jgi:hypothetical protein